MEITVSVDIKAREMYTYLLSSVQIMAFQPYELPLHRLTQSLRLRLTSIHKCSEIDESNLRDRKSASIQKRPLFSNFQVQRDSPSATKNAFLLCLNRRYIIHFQYSVSGFVILDLKKSRE